MSSADVKIVQVRREGDLDWLSVIQVLRSSAAVLAKEALEARKQMLAQVQDEQRAFWNGCFDAYAKASRVLDSVADDYEKENENAADPC